jgi:hypothetical protein
MLGVRVATLVGCHRVIAGIGEADQLVVPRVGDLREAV